MSGLDKIIEEIKREAEAESQQILSKAADEVEAINAEAMKEKAAILSDYEKKLKKELALIEERTKSTVELNERQMLLNKKQELIEMVLVKARETLVELPEDKYFGLLLNIAKENVLKGKGKILFSKRDKERIPASFEEELNASIKDGEIKVSDETRKIDGGFILVYGGIEENCSFDAIFRTERENLQDIVQKELF